MYRDFFSTHLLLIITKSVQLVDFLVNCNDNNEIEAKMTHQRPQQQEQL